MDRSRHRVYIDAWRERFAREEEERASAQAEARQQARACAECLVDVFGAERVYLIGSLGRPGRFRASSDIDLAVVGLPPAQYFTALGKLGEVAGRDIDLIAVEEATPSMAAHITGEGILLYERTEVPAAQG